MNFQIEQAVEILSRTPAVLKALVGNLSEEWTTNKVNADGWSAYDVVGHLIHGEETDWIPRARIILAQGDDRTFEPFDRFAQFERSKGKTLSELLETFAVARAESLEILRRMNITPEQLQLKASHPELGEVNLEQLLATWVVHDLTHIRQIVTVMAHRYSEDVGAWKEYLSILK
ncbi:MAG: DinB family protein [Acidobacteriota bacterium]|nr:DinB family protein [Acidobacteriota bacterium]